MRLRRVQVRGWSSILALGSPGDAFAAPVPGRGLQLVIQVTACLGGASPHSPSAALGQPDPPSPPGVFIIGWLPFFITHILNIHCDCNIPPVLYSAFTWLGYVNSAVNPIIYTTFNIEFRKAFLKILHC